MKQCLAGNGADSTSAVLSYLASNNQLTMRNLIIIGNPEDPFALFLTDHESPLTYSLYGTFNPAVITRGPVSSKIGLDVTSLSLNWTPNNRAFTNNVATTSPLQLAQNGFYDNWTVYVWTVFMPTPGDANTLGCCQLFGGRVAETQTDRNKIVFTVNSFLDVLDQQVPINTIELASTLAGFVGATPPAGETTVPSFTTFTGSTPNLVYGDVESPYSAHHIFTANAFIHGYAIFLTGPGSTLDGFWSAIAANADYFDGSIHHNAFTLYSPLPWAPTPYAGGSGDTFYVSAAPPINQADGDYYGFPYVPSPEQAA